MTVQQEPRLNPWSGRPVDVGGEQLAGHALRHAVRTPAAVAVRGHDRDLTYAGLDQESGSLARALQDAGAGPSSIVAVDLPRGST